MPVGFICSKFDVLQIWAADATALVGGVLLFGGYPNPERGPGDTSVLTHVSPLLARQAANEKLHRATVANALMHACELTVTFAERCRVNRHTVASPKPNWSTTGTLRAGSTAFCAR